MSKMLKDGARAVFPKESSVKDIKDADGHPYYEMDYRDTAEAIRKEQDEGVKKARAHKMKEGYRN